MTGIQTITAACVRTDSAYYHIPGVVPWDKRRDFRKCQDNYPVIAHPPCAQWGRTAPLANKNMSQKSLALLCLQEVRRCGGILEHPKDSSLWEFAGIPDGGRRDQFGGLRITIDQYDYGHEARKLTTLYLVGLPAMTAMQAAYELGRLGVGVKSPQKPKQVLCCSKAVRELTPAPLARAMCQFVRDFGLSRLEPDGSPRTRITSVVWDGVFHRSQ